MSGWLPHPTKSKPGKRERKHEIRRHLHHSRPLRLQNRRRCPADHIPLRQVLQSKANAWPATSIHWRHEAVCVHQVRFGYAKGGQGVKVLACWAMLK